MARRTQKQIEQDFRKIREAAKTAESFKDLEKITGLSYSMIIIINSINTHHSCVQKSLLAIRRPHFYITHSGSGRIIDIMF